MVSQELKGTQDSCITPYKAQRTSGKERRSGKIVRVKGREIYSKIHLPGMTQLQHSQTLPLWLPAQDLHTIGSVSTLSQMGQAMRSNPSQRDCWQLTVAMEGMPFSLVVWPVVGCPGCTKSLLLPWQVAQ